MKVHCVTCQAMHMQIERICYRTQMKQTIKRCGKVNINVRCVSIDLLTSREGSWCQLSNVLVGVREGFSFTTYRSRLLSCSTVSPARAGCGRCTAIVDGGAASAAPAPIAPHPSPPAARPVAARAIARGSRRGNVRVAVAHHT